MMTIELVSHPEPADSYWNCLNSIINEYAGIKTGKFAPLLINQGGIQNRLSPQAKESFKENVALMLETAAGVDHPLSGRVDGQLAEGILQKATLSFQCEEGHTIATPF